jgi:hypothetical protein
LQGTWRCVGAESGTKFDEVELSNDEPEWTEFDEKVRPPPFARFILLHFPAMWPLDDFPRLGSMLTPDSLAGERRREHHGVREQDRARLRSATRLVTRALDKELRYIPRGVRLGR